MKWNQPPDIKIYEALGAIADGRVHVEGDKAKVFSSSGNKFYEVIYSSELNAITANDNASFWKGYLGYPSIAFLLAIGKLQYESEYADALKGVAWKDINTRFKNDFSKTAAEVHRMLEDNGMELSLFLRAVSDIGDQIQSLGLDKLGPTAKPPEGY